MSNRISKQVISLQNYHAAYIDTEIISEKNSELNSEKNPKSSFGEDKILIFLHGFLGESSAWSPIIDQLQSQYRCIALDLLGFGDSSKPKLKYTIWHQVDFLQEFLAAITRKDLKFENLNSENLRSAPKKIYLVGHSYGGWTAAAFMLKNLKHPKNNSELKIQALTLIAPAGIRDDSFVGRYNYLRPLLWESSVVDLILNGIFPFAKFFGKNQEFEVIYQARKALVNQPVATSFLYDRWRPEDAIDTVENEIAAILVPTLVIAGAKDDTIPLWHCQTYADKIPAAKIEVLADATHALIQTHSTEVAGLISRFCI